MKYFTNASVLGPVRCIPIPWKIAVTEAPRDHKLIGVASKVGRTKQRAPVWSLKVRGADVPGRWTVVDGRFVEIGDSTRYTRQQSAAFEGRAIRMRAQPSIRGFLLLAAFIACTVAMCKIVLWASRAFRP